MTELNVRSVVHASRPRVAAVVLNWKQADLTRRCVESLRACGYADLRTLVIDNGSGASDEQALQAAVDPASEELRLLGDNLGYCAATNLGLRWAREQDATYILFLNNDVVVTEGFLDPLVLAMENDAGLAGVAPTILQPSGAIWCQGAVIGFLPNLTALCHTGRPLSTKPQGPQAVDYLPGACALYRLAELDNVGGLEDDYFMYFEDADLGERLRAAGRGVVVLPWVKVTHDAGSSSGGSKSSLRKYLMGVNSLRFLRAHGTLRLWTAFWLFDVLGLPLALLFSPRAGWAKFQGLIKGFSGHSPGRADVERWVTSP